MMDFDAPPPRSRYHDPRPARPQPTGHTEEPAPEPKTRKARRQPRIAMGGRRKLLKVLLTVVLIALVAWLAYGYVTTRNQLESQKNGSSASSSPSQQLIDRVGQLVDLPAGETPTIATVNDASKLKNQTFFANAKNGDKVLIYAKSGKAVLFRPSTNKVIEYSTVNLSSTPSQ